MSSISSSSGLLTGRKSQRVYHALHEELKAKRFHLGEQFHTISEICSAHAISSTTAVKCLDRLVEDGLLVRRQGSGTFVRQLPRRQPPTSENDSVKLSVPRCLDYVMPEDIGSRAGPEYLGELLNSVHRSHGDGDIALRVNLLPRRIHDAQQVEDWLAGRIHGGARAFVFRWMPRMAQEVAAAKGWPICVHGRPDTGIELPFVDFDQRQFGQEVGRHLIERGCRRVGVLMRAEWRGGDNLLVNGLLEQLRSRLAAIETAPPEDVEVDAAVRRLLDRRPAIDAVVVRNHPGSWLPGHVQELRGQSGPMPVVSESKWHPLVTHVVPAGPTIIEAMAGVLAQLMRGQRPESAGIELSVKVVPPRMGSSGSVW